MFKKLFLLIIGGATAAGGGLYYTSLPKEESAALVKSLSEQKVNLENIAKGIVESDMVKSAIEKGKQHLVESDQAQEWLAGVVQGYAQKFQGKHLSEQEAQDLVSVLKDLKAFSVEVGSSKGVTADSYTKEQKQRFEKIMNEGNTVFQQHLGISMTEFMTKINKPSFQQAMDSAQ